MPNYNFTNTNSRFLADQPQPNNPGSRFSHQESIRVGNKIYCIGGVVNPAGSLSQIYNPVVTTSTSVEFNSTNWTFSNSTNNKWEFGTRRNTIPATGNSAYVVTSANNLGYTNNTTSRSFFHRTFSLTSVASASITFNLHTLGETSYDGVMVWITSNTTTAISGNTTTSSAPLAGVSSIPGITATRLATYSSTTGTTTNPTISIPSSFLSAPFRIIFEWRNDSGTGSSGPTSGAQIANFTLNTTGQLFINYANTIGTAINSLLIYDTDNNSWTQGANLPFPVKKCQIFEHNGLIYVFGGITDLGQFSFNYTYNISTNQWTQMPAPPDSGYYIAGASYGKLIVNNVPYFYMVGGVNASEGFPSNVNFVLRYQPDTGVWDKITKNSSFARPIFGLSAVINNRLYYTLGVNNGSTAVLAMRCFDPSLPNEEDIYQVPSFSPATETIEGTYNGQTANIHQALFGMTSVDNDIFLFGESFVYRMNVLDNNWRKINNIAIARKGTTPVYFNNYIYLIGGSSLQPLERYSIDQFITQNGNIEYDTFQIKSNWTSSKFDSGSSICWSPERNLFVSFGGGGGLWTSSNGDGWILNLSAPFGDWSSVCWSPQTNLFVAVGTNQVLTSSNGISWSSNSVSGNWSSVCYSAELNLFVAVAPSGTNRVMSSSDGSAWTIRDTGSNGGVSVCWSPERNLFVSVNEGTNSITSSSDGITWTVRRSTSELMKSVCWSPEKAMFVAIDNTTTFDSFDGITWTKRTSALGNTISGPAQICFSPKLGIFVLSNGQNAQMHNWIIKNASNGFGNGSSINSFIVGNSGYTDSIPSLYLTTDGINRGYVATSPRLIYAYRKVVLPANSTGAKIVYNMTQGGEVSFDGVNIWATPDLDFDIQGVATNAFSVASAPRPGSNAQLVTSISNGASSNIRYFRDIPSSAINPSNNSFVLILQWNNDNTGGGGLSNGVLFDGLLINSIVDVVRPPAV